VHFLLFQGPELLREAGVLLNADRLADGGLVDILDTEG